MTAGSCHGCSLTLLNLCKVGKPPLEHADSIVEMAEDLSAPLLGRSNGHSDGDANGAFANGTAEDGPSTAAEQQVGCVPRGWREEWVLQLCPASFSMS